MYKHLYISFFGERVTHLRQATSHKATANQGLRRGKHVTRTEGRARRDKDWLGPGLRALGLRSFPTCLRCKACSLGGDGVSTHLQQLRNAGFLAR
jgi:hypothetical protein